MEREGERKREREKGYLQRVGGYHLNQPTSSLFLFFQRPWISNADNYQSHHRHLHPLSQRITNNQKKCKGEREGREGRGWARAIERTLSNRTTRGKRIDTQDRERNFNDISYFQSDGTYRTSSTPLSSYIFSSSTAKERTGKEEEELDSYLLHLVIIPVWSLTPRNAVSPLALFAYQVYVPPYD